MERAEFNTFCVRELVYVCLIGRSIAAPDSEPKEDSDEDEDLDEDQDEEEDQSGPSTGSDGAQEGEQDDAEEGAKDMEDDSHPPEDKGEGDVMLEDSEKGSNVETFPVSEGDESGDNACRASQVSQSRRG
jgi:hypothetical protein